jgi:hypothetical protein
MQKRIEIGGHDHLETMNWQCVNVRAEMCAPPEWRLERMWVCPRRERDSLVRSVSRDPAGHGELVPARNPRNGAGYTR